MKQGIIQHSLEIVRVMPYAISNQNSGTNLYTSLICENPEFRSLIKHFSNIIANFVMVNHYPIPLSISEEKGFNKRWRISKGNHEWIVQINWQLWTHKI